MFNKTATLKCKQGTEVTEAILRAVEGTNCCQLMRISRQVATYGWLVGIVVRRRSKASTCDVCCNNNGSFKELKLSTHNYSRGKTYAVRVHMSN